VDTADTAVWVQPQAAGLMGADPMIGADPMELNSARYATYVRGSGCLGVDRVNC
jgi:hypothetical protein